MCIDNRGHNLYEIVFNLSEKYCLDFVSFRFCFFFGFTWEKNVRMEKKSDDVRFQFIISLFFGNNEIAKSILIIQMLSNRCYIP